MKLKNFFINICIIMIGVLFIPNDIFAAEIFKNESSTYALEKANLKNESLTHDYVFIGMDENDNYIFENYIESKYYKVNESNCTLMSNQEVLDFKNNNSKFEYMDILDYGVYKIEELFSIEYYYIKTSDTAINVNKEYVTLSTSSGIVDGFIPVENPNVSDINNYYELKVFRYPTIAEIDNNIAYYEVNKTIGAVSKVENPVRENILNYRLLVEEKEAIKSSKVTTLDRKIFDYISANNVLFNINYDKKTNNIYLLFDRTSENKTAIYTSNGTLVKEIPELYDFQIYHNALFAYYTKDTFKIANKNFETIFESKTIPFLQQIKNSDYVYYLLGFEQNGTTSIYNIYDYKLLSEDNQVYKNSDIQIKFSGKVDRLTSVKVNGQELNKSNYILESGSSIITLRNEYLKTLPAGTHTLEGTYIDGVTLKTSFIIENVKDNTPKTGFDFIK